MFKNFKIKKYQKNIVPFFSSYLGFSRSKKLNLEDGIKNSPFSYPGSQYKTEGFKDYTQAKNKKLPIFKSNVSSWSNLYFSRFISLEESGEVKGYSYVFDPYEENYVVMDQETWKQCKAFRQHLLNNIVAHFMPVYKFGKDDEENYHLSRLLNLFLFKKGIFKETIYDFYKNNFIKINKQTWKDIVNKSRYLRTNWKTSWKLEIPYKKIPLINEKEIPKIKILKILFHEKKLTLTQISKKMGFQMIKKDKDQVTIFDPLDKNFLKVSKQKWNDILNFRRAYCLYIYRKK